MSTAGSDLRQGVFLKGRFVVYHRHSVFASVTAELINISAARICLVWDLRNGMSYSWLRRVLPLMMKDIWET